MPIQPMDRVPRPLRADHDELRAALERLVQEGGPIGDAARAVFELLLPHEAREEVFALAPLTLLPAIAAGRVTQDMAWAVATVWRLKVELPAMLDEHIAIVGAVRTLMEEAQEVGRPDVAALAERMIRHAEFEEDVLYPAAVLVGEHLARTL